MMKPVLFLRIAAVLTFIHSVLHTIGGVFGGVDPGPAATAVQAMKINQFLVMGHTRSYWDFYRGMGLAVTIFLTAEAVVFWQLGSLAKTAATADSGYVSGCVCGAGGELLRLHLSAAGNCGDLDRGVPRVGDCHR